MKKMIAILCWLMGSVSSAEWNGCGFPPRTNSGPWSSRSFYSINSQPGAAREVAVVREVMTGNVPDRMRRFSRIRLAATWRDQSVTLQIDVAPDYLEIGTNDDFVRTPLTPFAAQYLASEMGYVLPTTYLVDRIYDQATIKMTPQPTDWYKNSSSMRLGSNYLIFNKTLEQQKAGREGLTAGHKKDVVATNRLDPLPIRVAIYGWQNTGNKPIQPLSLVHENSYEDYSHGVRLLGPNLHIFAADGRLLATVPMPQALTDAELGPLLNGGASLHDARAGRECAVAFAQALGLNATACPTQPKICPD